MLRKYNYTIPSFSSRIDFNEENILNSDLFLFNKLPIDSVTYL